MTRGVRQQPGWDQLLDHFIDAERRLLQPEYSKPRNGWRASSFGFCVRRQTYERAGFAKTRKIETKTKRTFKWGDKVHEFVKLVYVRAGLLVVPDPLNPLRTEWNYQVGTLTGHLDALVVGPPRKITDEPPEVYAKFTPEWQGFIAAFRREVLAAYGDAFDTPTGIEVKSAASFAMRKIRDDGPYPHHLLQIAAAGLAAREVPNAFPVRPRAWRVQYVGKEAVGTLTFDLPGGTIDRAAERLKILDESWASGVLPPCECAELDQVRWCDYGDGKGSCCGISDDERLHQALQASLEASEAGRA